MKNLKKIYSILLVAFFLFVIVDVSAQPRHKKYEKARKEYIKKREKAYKASKKRERKWVDNRRHDDRRYRDDRRRVGKRNGPPSWAPAHGYRAKHHVYFRDYNTFYDPYRGGYVYRSNSEWMFSRNVPSFMVGVNLGRARVQVLTDLPLNRRPERYYDRYSKRYPRDPKIRVNINLF